MKLKEVCVTNFSKFGFPFEYKNEGKDCKGKLILQRGTLGAIYKITCEETNRSYIGRSTNPYSRAYTHLTLLRRGTHSYEEMQKDFDEYGEDSFTFDIIAIEHYGEDKEKAFQAEYQTYDEGLGYNYNDSRWYRNGSPTKNFDEILENERFKGFLQAKEKQKFLTTMIQALQVSVGTPENDRKLNSEETIIALEEMLKIARCM